MNTLPLKDLQKATDWLGSGSINLFGMPYAGKDTQGSELARIFNGSLMGGGQILRSSTIPQHVQQEMDKGHLIATKDFVEIVLPYLSKNEFAGRPLILSSVGRWHGEEDGVIAAAAASNHPLKAVVFLTIDEQTFQQRWEYSHREKLRTRADDVIQVQEKRIAEFKEKTLPVIETYRDLGLLIEVDGSKPVTEVMNAIVEALAQRATLAL